MNNQFWKELYEQSQDANIPTGEIPILQKNHDLSQPAFEESAGAEWLASPAPGVKRIVFERDGGEKTTRATSIVAYSPNSTFNAHAHPRGEEFLVLHGTFSDEHGHYPAGSYIRNPPGSSHKPFSQEGCLIFVKLQQFQMSDENRVVIDTTDSQSTAAGEANGRQSVTCFDDYEIVAIYDFQKDHTLHISKEASGTELLILNGSFTDNMQTYTTGEWLRFPPAFELALTALEPSLVYVKTNHLAAYAK